MALPVAGGRAEGPGDGVRGTAALASAGCCPRTRPWNGTGCTPGAVTAVELDPGDVLTVIDEEAPARRAHRAGRPGRGLPRARDRGRHAATVLRSMATPDSLAGRGLDPGQRGPWRCSASGRRPDAAEFAAGEPDRRGGGARRAESWRGQPPSDWWEVGGSARGGRSSVRCRRRWPIPLLDLRVDTPRHVPTRSRPASTSR